MITHSSQLYNAANPAHWMRRAFIEPHSPHGQRLPWFNRSSMDQFGQCARDSLDYDSLEPYSKEGLVITAGNMIYLVRHGETAWSITGQHTGLSDIPLTPRGEEDARALAPRLKDIAFDHVLSSPLQRARRTCELAGFLGVAKLDPDLVEWDYGDYEGRRLAQIHRERPEWELFRDGSPGGESVLQITQRVDRVMSRLRAVKGNILIFFQRACAARARRAVDRRRRITRAQPGAGPNRRMRAGLRARPAG
jgi:broad specificity phosphatase PhoE